MTEQFPNELGSKTGWTSSASYWGCLSPSAHILRDNLDLKRHVASGKKNILASNGYYASKVIPELLHP